MMKSKNTGGWSKYFPDYQIPTDILDLVKAGILSDTTSHNDSIPTFGLDQLYICCDHPEKAEREFQDEHRFTVYCGQCSSDKFGTENLIETNDLALAINTWKEHLIKHPQG